MNLTSQLHTGSAEVSFDDEESSTYSFLLQRSIQVLTISFGGPFLFQEESMRRIQSNINDNQFLQTFLIFFINMNYSLLICLLFKIYRISNKMPSNKKISCDVTVYRRSDCVSRNKPAYTQQLFSLMEVYASVVFAIPEGIKRKNNSMMFLYDATSK